MLNKTSLFPRLFPSSYLLGLLLLCGSWAQAQTMGNRYAAYFDEAYERYPTVPQGLLEAVAYTNTRMNHLAPRASCQELPTFYGVMGLVKDGKDYFQNSLERVAQLSDEFDEEDIISSPRASILAYAEAYSKLKANKRISTRSVTGHGNILADLSEIPQDNSVHNKYAMDQQFYSVLVEMQRPHVNTRHRTRQVFNFEQIFGKDNYRVLSAKRVTVSTRSISGAGAEFSNRSAGCTETNEVTDFQGALWSKAHSNNYGSRGGKKIKYVTIHTVQGSYASCISWFRNSRARVSAHYVIRASDGQITQMVCEKDKAYHVRTDNAEAVGIEHEGFIDDGASWYTNEMYESSAELVRDICRRHNINPLQTFGGPPTSGVRPMGNLCYRVKGHQHFRGNTHIDPGPFWDWDRFYRLLNPEPDPKVFTARKGEIFDSGGNDADYGSQERITYLIQPRNATAVTLEFKAFETEGEPGKPYDYLDIYDGKDINGRYLGRFYGKDSPGTLVSKTGSVFMEFRSDCDITKPGWHLSYTSTRKDAACGLPASLLASNISPMFSTLSWDKVDGAEKYVVTVRRKLGNRVGVYTTTKNVITLTGLGASGSYQWQIQAVCDGDSSAVSGDSFITPSISRSSNPKTYTINTTSGRLYDSGGTLGGYGNNEDYVYRIIPASRERLELTFTTFETEAEHDVLEVFDGQDTTGRRLGAFDGKNMPLGRAFRSSGNGLTVRFRSDNRTNAPGWTASWRTIPGSVVDADTNPNNNNTADPGNITNPTGNTGVVLPPPVSTSFDPGLNYASTAPETSPQLADRYQSSFRINFNDRDRSGRGLVARFYNVAFATDKGYQSNGENGFFYADFDRGLGNNVWTKKTGSWTVENGLLKQADQAPGNTNLYASLKQDGNNVYVYHWKARMSGNGGNLRHGMHFMVSDPNQSQRGNSYFIWIRDGRAGDFVEIYKTFQNKFDRKNQKQVSLQTGKVYDFKAIYNPQKGRIEVYLNNRFTVSWVDPYPLRSGEAISLRSGNCVVEYDDIIVYKRRNSSSAQVTVGSRRNSDLPAEGGFLVSSLVVDRNIRWSKVGQANSIVGNSGAAPSDPVVTDPPVDESGTMLSFKKDFTYSLSPPANSRPFYLVADYDGQAWGANDQLGFFLDEFSGNRLNGRWEVVKGNWQFQDGLLEQSDQNEGNGNIFAELRQTRDEVYLYHWRAKLISRGDNQRFGLHFFASDGKRDNRGDSYFVWFRNYNGKQDKVEMYRVDNDVFEQKAVELVSLNPNTWYDCKVLFNPANGLIQVFLNNQLVMGWTDPAPHRAGIHFSFRSGNSHMQFSDMRVYKQSAQSSPAITVGNSNKMIRFKSQGEQPAARIFSLSLSPDNRWSEVKMEPIKIE
jgi:N-acetyl-anhydromuramyl-L-alanine amidase AmpD